MQVTQAIKDRVIAKLQQGIARAEAHYKQKFAMPRVIYKKRGTTGGTASYSTWTINLNAGLLMRNVDDFIDGRSTVLHELGHLINDKVNPEDHKSAGYTTVIRAGKEIRKRLPRDVHGAGWQSVCTVIGMTDVTRCHDYDVTETKIHKPKRRVDAWKCTRCGFILMLTPLKSSRLVAKPDAIYHRGCRGALLIREGATAPVAAPVQRPVPVLLPAGSFTLASIAKVTPQGTVTLYQAPAGASKIDKCKAIYQRNKHEPRSEMIKLFVGVGCTPLGAGTYYATCKKLFG